MISSFIFYSYLLLYLFHLLLATFNFNNFLFYPGSFLFLLFITRPISYISFWKAQQLAEFVDCVGATYEQETFVNHLPDIITWDTQNFFMLQTPALNAR